MPPLFKPDPTYAAVLAHPRRRRSRLWVPPGTGNPTPPAFILNDNFTGADGTNLTAHTSDSGHSWSVQPGNGGGATIQSNAAMVGTGTSMIASATPPSADYEVAAQCIIKSAIHNTSWGVIGRASNAADTKYNAFLYAFSGNFSLYLSRLLSGAYLELTNVALPSQPAAGSTHEVKLKMVGTAISVYYDTGLLIGPITNSEISAAGFAGFSGSAATTTTGVHFDSITAT